MPSERIVTGYGLYEKLREFKPVKLVAFTDDDEKVEVNVPDVRQKHARVMTALREIMWVRVDLLDKKGGLLARHTRCADDRDVPAGDVEDLRSSTTRTAELASILNIITRAQDTAVIRNQQSIDQLLARQNELTSTLMRQIEFQANAHREAMQMNHALSADLVNMQLGQLQLVAGPPETDDDGNAKPQTNSDRALAQLMPAFLRAAMTPTDRKPAKPAAPPVDAKPAAETNGAAKVKTS